MKRYLLGSLAVVLAIALVSFTKPAPRFATKYFKFIGTTPQQTSEANKWVEVTLAQYNALECDGVRQGCRIAVNDAYTTGTPGSLTLTQSVPVNNPETTNEQAKVDNIMTTAAANFLE